MKQIRVYDEAGNDLDYPCNFVPRIGERIVIQRGAGAKSVKPEYYRVKDVMYKLDNDPEDQAAILVERETKPTHWPA